MQTRVLTFYSDETAYPLKCSTASQRVMENGLWMGKSQVAHGKRLVAPMGVIIEKLLIVKSIHIFLPIGGQMQISHVFKISRRHFVGSTQKAIKQKLVIL